MSILIWKRTLDFWDTSFSTCLGCTPVLKSKKQQELHREVTEFWGRSYQENGELKKTTWLAWLDCTKMEFGLTAIRMTQVLSSPTQFMSKLQASPDDGPLDWNLRLWTNNFTFSGLYLITIQETTIREINWTFFKYCIKKSLL